MALPGSRRTMDDLLYSLSTSLEQYKGRRGFNRLLNAGKLSLLSLFGEFEKTKDEIYDQRSKAVLQTRHCLLRLNEHVDSITRTTDKLVGKIETFFATLDELHKYCDLELLVNDEDSAENVVALTEKFNEMHSLNTKLDEAFSEFSESKATCHHLFSATIAQLEQADTQSTSAVLKAQNEFDVARHEVQVKRTELERVRAYNNSTGNPASAPLAEMHLQQASDRMNELGETYVSALRTAMSSTKFALEQTSMTAWASCNVFFVQLTTLLRELTGVSGSAAEIMNVIKNSQKVSRSITHEKRTVLEGSKGTENVSSDVPISCASGSAEVLLFGAARGGPVVPGIEEGDNGFPRAGQAGPTHIDPNTNSAGRAFEEWDLPPRPLPTSMPSQRADMLPSAHWDGGGSQLHGASSPRPTAPPSSEPYSIDELFS